MTVINHNFDNNTTLMKMESRGSSGCVSFISWKELLPYFDKAFNVRLHERIVSVDASEHGITAVFELKEPE